MREEGTRKLVYQVVVRAPGDDSKILELGMKKKKKKIGVQKKNDEKQKIPGE